ncbi:hypothetical protein [Variovorax ginsengisoli]|uniref:Uncharacterized protein n=1 Tax=Variovorax ginsengisoli TaxID=363844 RepID=A0ABT8S1S1_9BURK|nr:hypothetical protein [Variovorax ginsengisoli]MDN8612752.1 hypothetical protein [Variovorax ginsengisoli]MDO1531922.1 hypothetical protein [Variovorax ginsengisoli]
MADMNEFDPSERIRSWSAGVLDDLLGMYLRHELTWHEYQARASAHVEAADALAAPSRPAATEEPLPPLYRVHADRSYDQRAKSIIAFNTCKGDLDDKLDAAWRASLGAPSQPAQAQPMHPLVTDEHGVLRFKENRIVSALLEHSRKHGYGLNETARGVFTPEEHMQVAQLIGYSLDGYGTLSYVTDESYGRAAESAKAIAKVTGSAS